MRVLVVGDPHGKVAKKIPRDIDLVLITGDLGKADLARKRFFGDIERKKKGLPEFEETSDFVKKMWGEIYDSTMKVVKYYSKIVPTYSILGNVGTATDYEIKKEEEKWGIKLPRLRSEMKKIKNFHIVRNGIRKIDNLRIGFLEYFYDVCETKEFGEKDIKNLKRAKKETARAKRILNWFDKIDILVSHQPPYGILDKITWKKAPKSRLGKRLGSKIVLDYVKKKQPKYVFCGHVHEGRGKKKVGKTVVVNAGADGDYFIVDIK